MVLVSDSYLVPSNWQICTESQLTRFYMRSTLALNGLIATTDYFLLLLVTSGSSI